MPKNTLLRHFGFVKTVQSDLYIGDMLAYNQSTGISIREEHTVEYTVYATSSLNMCRTLSLLYVMQRLALVSGDTFECKDVFNALFTYGPKDMGMPFKRSFDFVLIEGEECDN